jgi:hypothetical protein
VVQIVEAGAERGKLFGFLSGAGDQADRHGRRLHARDDEEVSLLLVEDDLGRLIAELRRHARLVDVGRFGDVRIGRENARFRKHVVF